MYYYRATFHRQLEGKGIRMFFLPVIHIILIFRTSYIPSSSFSSNAGPPKRADKLRNIILSLELWKSGFRHARSCIKESYQEDSPWRRWLIVDKAHFSQIRFIRKYWRTGCIEGSKSMRICLPSLFWMQQNILNQLPAVRWLLQERE